MIRIFAMKASGQDFMLPHWDRYLSEKRREEALRRKNNRERELYLAAEILLNRSLEAVAAETELPVRYERNVHGKPYLLPPNDRIFVSWSHSGEYVICAASDREVGIDLQRMDREPRESLVKKTLQPEELAHYRTVPEEEQMQLFYQYWTVKESYLKMLGTGFWTPLEHFRVEMTAEGPMLLPGTNGTERFRKCSCCLLDFVDKSYTAAVCCEGRADNVVIEYF